MRNEKYTCILLVILMVSVAAQAGTIKGTIDYEGPIPKLRPINMEADPICHAKHDTPVLPETIVLGEGQTLGNVFVRVTNAPKKGHKTPEEPVVISQKGCVYAPHVLGIMVNQQMKIRNEDGTLHNVHALCKKNKEFNVAMPGFRKEFTKTFKEEEFMFLMKCDVHPWMGGYIGVLSQPYFAVTGNKGSFSIKNLPPGDYVIEAWHERLGAQTQNVTIGEKETKKISFTFTVG